MKRVLFALISTTLIFISLSFISSSNSNWELYKEIDGVKIFTQEIKCTGNSNALNSYLIFKYENTNSNAKTLNWRMDLYYNGVCRACNLKSPSEYDMELQLNAKEIKKGDCKSDSHAFKVFKSDRAGSLSPLDKFEFTNLVVK